MLSEDEKKLLKIFKAQVEKEETEYFSVNAYTQLLYDSHKTVLNLITKLQKENEEKDKTIEKYIKIYKEYDCYRWVKELEKKDKQIDLMAEMLVGITYYDYKDKNIEKIFNSKEEVKQYFERKSKE